MRNVLMFWRPGPNTTLSHDAIGQELSFGEDVEGLIDLPIKEIIARLKTEFAGSQEKAGLLILYGQEGPLDVTWSWQFVRIDGRLDDADKQKLIAALRDFD